MKGRGSEQRGEPGVRMGGKMKVVSGGGVRDRVGTVSERQKNNRAGPPTWEQSGSLGLLHTIGGKKRAASPAAAWGG